MKVRNGFVSNSSSSSFVVFKPSSEKFTEEKLDKILIDEYDVSSEELSEEEYLIDVKNQILNITKNMDGVEVIFTDVEYDSEDEVQSILELLDIPYIILDN